MKNLLHYLYTLMGVLLCISCDHNDSIIQKNADYHSVMDYDIYTLGKLAFIHISDTHGSDISLVPAIYFLENSHCYFGLLTGDILCTSTIQKELGNVQKPFLLIPGNHDAYTVYEGAVGQKNFRTQVLNKIGQESYVTFGNDSSNYWFRDFLHEGYTLRVIGLDQYELESIGHPADTWKLQNLYSQQQINWLIHLLEQSEHIDGIIIAIHNGFGNKKVGARDTTATVNNFTSILANHYENSYDYYGTGNTLMIPDIIHAYQTGQNLSNKKYANSTIVQDTLTVTTNFNKPCNNFIAYLGGHLHYDLVETLPNYPQQLQILITDCGQTGQSQNLDDVLKGEMGNKPYCFNLNVINFERRQIMIKRIGANKTINGDVRDSIVFNF